jgi:hypothetical protein
VSWEESQLLPVLEHLALANRTSPIALQAVFSLLTDPPVSASDSLSAPVHTTTACSDISSGADRVNLSDEGAERILWRSVRGALSLSTLLDLLLLLLPTVGASTSDSDPDSASGPQTVHTSCPPRPLPWTNDAGYLLGRVREHLLRLPQPGSSTTASTPPRLLPALRRILSAPPQSQPLHNTLSTEEQRYWEQTAGTLQTQEQARAQLFTSLDKAQSQLLLARPLLSPQAYSHSSITTTLIPLSFPSHGTPIADTASATCEDNLLWTLLLLRQREEEEGGAGRGRRQRGHKRKLSPPASAVSCEHSVSLASLLASIKQLLSSTLSCPLHSSTATAPPLPSALVRDITALLQEVLEARPQLASCLLVELVDLVLDLAAAVQAESGVPSTGAAAAAAGGAGAATLLCARMRCMTSLAVLAWLCAHSLRAAADRDSGLRGEALTHTSDCVAAMGWVVDKVALLASLSPLSSASSSVPPSADSLIAHDPSINEEGKEDEEEEEEGVLIGYLREHTSEVLTGLLSDPSTPRGLQKLLMDLLGVQMRPPATHLCGETIRAQCGLAPRLTAGAVRLLTPRVSPDGPPRGPEDRHRHRHRQGASSWLAVTRLADACDLPSQLWASACFAGLLFRCMSSRTFAFCEIQAEIHHAVAALLPVARVNSTLSLRAVHLALISWLHVEFGTEMDAEQSLQSGGGAGDERGSSALSVEMLDVLLTLLDALQSAHMPIISVLETLFLSGSADSAAAGSTTLPRHSCQQSIVSSLNTFANGNSTLTVLAAIFIVVAREDSTQRRRGSALTHDSAHKSRYELVRDPGDLLFSDIPVHDLSYYLL